MNKVRRCVLGHDISYSLSPVMHAAIYKVTGEDGEYTVEDIAPDSLEREFARLMREYDGFNVTKPHKEHVARLLGLTGSVNTVKNDGRATTTDPVGFIEDYRHELGEPQGNVLVLGAGGAAMPLIELLCSLPDTKVYVYNRTYERAKQAEKYGAKAAESAAGKYDCVINCTSLGLCGEQAAPPSLDFTGVGCAYDLVYSPALTPFMSKAREAGVKVVGGMGMLVRQAIASHEFWRGEKFDPELRERIYIAARDAVEKEIRRKS